MPKKIDRKELVMDSETIIGEGKGGNNASLIRAYFIVSSDGTIVKRSEFRGGRKGSKLCKRVWKGKSRTSRARVGSGRFD